MGESWLSVLLAATLTTMTMMAVTKADSSSMPFLSTTARDDIVDSKRVCLPSLISFDYYASPLFLTRRSSNSSEGGHRGSLGRDRGGIDGFPGRGLRQYGGI